MMNIMNSIYQKDSAPSTTPFQNRMYPFRFINPAVSANNRYLSDIRAFREANSAYESSRPWCCYKDRDYCPLVIGLMTFVIIISFLLIVYFCVKSCLRSKRMRRVFRCLKRRFTPTGGAHFDGDSDEDDDDDSLNEMQRNAARLWMRHNNLSSSALVDSRSPPLDGSRIWFTDVSKYSLTPPPPSYDMSQQMTNAQAPKPRTFIDSSAPLPSAVAASSSSSETANVNGAFSMEPASESASLNSAPIFPQYRCLTLTTNPSSHLSAVRCQLNTIAGQLEQERRAAPPCPSYFANKRRSNTLVLGGMDEVPPAYETVIKHKSSFASPPLSQPDVITYH